MENGDALEILEVALRRVDVLIAETYESRVAVDALERSVAEIRAWLLVLHDQITLERLNVFIDRT